MNEKLQELTIAQFIEAWAAANDEPENKVKEKVWKWVQTGHLPTHKVPNKTGILVTTADPTTFHAPPMGPKSPRAENGYRASTVARKLGVTRQAIHQRLKRAGIDDGIVPFALFETWESAKKKRVK